MLQAYEGCGVSKTFRYGSGGNRRTNLTNGVFYAQWLMAVAACDLPFELRTEDRDRRSDPDLCQPAPVYERMMPVFANTGIRRRQSVRPYSWFRQGTGNY